MIEFDPFYQLIAESPLNPWLDTLPHQLAHWRQKRERDDIKKWLHIIDNLPQVTPSRLDLLHRVHAEITPEFSDHQREEIKKLLRGLMPWRKGPFSLYGVNVDTEWRSDWKWQRILPHLSSLEGRTVLDVGCGNGYHLWRMLGSGVRLAIGIDPMPLFFCQFEAVRKLLAADQRAHLLPLVTEQLPALKAFDTVFSMGVLYHRRSPLEHLYQLKDQLVSGGELVLETLVVTGDKHHVLVPGDRYAQMRNVYFIPSPQALQSWLAKCGFIDINTVNIVSTTLDEQRRTDWINSASLADFLDPHDHSKTIEGYPAPLRATLIARKP